MDERLRTVERILVEQQAQINIVLNFTKQVVSAHAAIRKLHKDLRDSHCALCRSLCRMGLVSQADVSTCQQPGSFPALLRLPDVVHILILCLGPAAIARLSAISLLAMESLRLAWPDENNDQCQEGKLTERNSAQPASGSARRVPKNLDAADCVAEFPRASTMPCCVEEDNALQASDLRPQTLKVSIRDLLQYFSIADNLICSMGASTIQCFGASFSAGRECTRDVSPKVSHSSAVEATPRLDVGPDLFLQLQQTQWSGEVALTLAGAAGMQTARLFNEVSRAGRERILRITSVPSSADQPANLSSPLARLNRHFPHQDQRCPRKGGVVPSGTRVRHEPRQESRGGKLMRPGQCVQLRGLQVRPELNGARGVLVSFEASMDRWHIVLANGEPLRIKPSNILLASSRAGESWKSNEFMSRTPASLPPPPAHLRFVQALTSDRSTMLTQLADFAGPSVIILKFTSRSALAAFASLRRLYVCGGCAGSSIHCSAECLELGAKAWRALPAMAGPRLCAASAVLDRRLYVFGGSATDGVLSTAERFDPATGAWKTMAPMSRARCFACSTILGGQIYACGGMLKKGAILNSAERFDPAGQCWQMLPAMLQPRCGAIAVVLEGHLYVCGGTTGEVVGLVERFDTRAHSWGPVSHMSQGRCFAGSAVLGRCLYICGGITHCHSLDPEKINSKGLPGLDRGHSLSLAERFDLSANAWKVLPPMMESRFGASTAAMDNKRLVVCGGIGTGSGYGLKTIEVFDTASGIWEIAERMAHCRAFAITAVTAGHLWVCGGSNGHGALDSAERLDLATGRWEELPRMSAPRSCHVGGLVP